MVSSVLTFDGGKSSNSSVDSKTLTKPTAASGFSSATQPSSILNNDPTISSPILTDQISILFPKCRPRNEVNLNDTLINSNLNSIITSKPTSSTISVVHLTTSTETKQQSPPTSSLSSETSTTTKSPNIGTNPFLNSLSQYEINTVDEKKFCELKNVMNDNNKTNLNTLTEQTKTNFISNMSSSNIDGISKYSQKRPNHAHQYKQIHSIQQPHQLAEPQHHQQYNYYQYSQNPFIKDSERCIWEFRNRNASTVTTPASTVLNSPDLIEMETKLNFQKNHSIKVGRSPVNNHHTIMDHQHSIVTSIPQKLQPPQTSKSSNVVSDGEIVVFDDIGDNYGKNKMRSELNINDYSMEKSLFPPHATILSQTPDLYNCVENTKLNDYNDLRNTSGIMEYDGSPRKFGQTQQIDISMYTTPNIRTQQVTSSSSLFPPRPGFPQRVFNNTQFPQPAHLIGSQQHTGQSTNCEIINNQASVFNPCSTDDTSNDVSEICNSSDFTLSEVNKKSTFDYLYEFSETRKVLEEFFKCPSNDDEKTLEKLSDFNESDVESIDINYDYPDQNIEKDESVDSYIGQRLAKSPDISFQDRNLYHSPKENGFQNSNNNNNSVIQNDCRDLTDFDLFLDSASRSSGEIGDDEIVKNNGSRRYSRCFPYSPETTDYDSNCGDLDSEVSLRLIGSEFGLSGEFNNASTYTAACTKFYTSMPVLEDGLSSGHASDTENNNISQPISVVLDNNIDIVEQDTFMDNEIDSIFQLENSFKVTPIVSPVIERHKDTSEVLLQNNSSCKNIFKNTDPDLESLYSIRKIDMVQLTPPPPAPAAHRKTSLGMETPDIQAALKDIRATLQRTKTLPTQINVVNEKLLVSENVKTPMTTSPIWVPRLRENSENLDSIENPIKNLSGDEDEADTDLETDRLLGHQRLDDMGFYDEKNAWCDRKPRSILSSSISKLSPKINQATNIKNGGSSILRQGLNSLLPTNSEIGVPGNNRHNANNLVDIRVPSLSSPEHDNYTPQKLHSPPNIDDSPQGSNSSNNDGGEVKKKTKSKEVLIEGVLFRARYLGSTQLVCEGQPTKSTRMIQAEEAVSRIKSPDGETQPSTEVDLFISTEKIMVLNTDLKEIMMDHALRTISYIADIGDLVVLMARRRFVPSEMDDSTIKPNRTPKMICHVFESEEAQFIAQSIGQAFQVAYMEFLKANGIEDHSFVKEMDYQEVLNSQEIFGDELEIFAKKELQKEVVVPKAKGEILGVVIVESGWGSMLPTVVIANLLSSGAAARCGQLNIGDQIIAINGLSLVGLPLSTCQNYIKNTKNQTVVKFTVVPCAPVVEVKIKRPNTKYQLGFSVQNGVICSLLRGGIAERGGVRVGHRIIEINNQSVVAVPHEKIVNLLATSVGEILMKTMPTSMFRLLTGQENPIYI